MDKSTLLNLSSLRARTARLACRVISAAVVFLLPVMALAQRGEEEGSDLREARLEGFGFGARLPEGGPALTYLLFVFLAALCLAVMFKNARRTHLD